MIDEILLFHDPVCLLIDRGPVFLDPKEFGDEPFHGFFLAAIFQDLVLRRIDFFRLHLSAVVHPYDRVVQRLPVPVHRNDR
ncbi:hypothetical protein SDC9_197447 [bioreactor metagenome]|uniref:Uncharacterized protein n=1 Tax=bioreactor metagenome TaxID=1076179 RepID=A0A645IEW7_9ZZZZ